MTHPTNITLAVIMDPIEQIKIHKDSTFAMLLEAQRRGWSITYLQPQDLSQHQGRTYANGHHIQVMDNPNGWYQLGDPINQPLDHYSLVLMRQDPPFDMEYLYSTQLLQQPAEAGTLVVNHPRALREANEKLVTGRFPELAPPSLVSRSIPAFQQFIDQHQDVILKPLDGMGGASIFRVRQNDPNRNVILETLTDHGSKTAMAQTYIPEILAGDKRILVIDGEPIPYALARIPAQGETRANLAAGGRGEGVPLTDRDRQIVSAVAPYLRANGILFAGLDVIGDYLTEINITSPTCIRELDHLYPLNIAGQLFDCLTKKYLKQE